MKKIVLVLGMHRSATSMTTEILASYRLYVGSGEDLLKPAKDNQRGYFENKYAVLCNDKILYEHGMHWASLKNGTFITKTRYMNEIVEILQGMIEKAEQNQTLLLKDPRMCLLEPVWKKQFDDLSLKEQIVMVFRHPYEVAESLRIRDNLNFSYALKLWFFYNYSALCSIAACDMSAIVLNHNDYFIDYQKQIEKIENFLHWKETKSAQNRIVDIALRHNDVSEIQKIIDPELNKAVIDMYQYLLELSEKKDIVISQEKLKNFSEDLKKMTEKSYVLDRKDKEPVVFRNCLGIEKKMWCTYQLQYNSKVLLHKFCQSHESGELVKCSIYGNGTLTKALLPILVQAEICVEIIYDQKQTQNNPITDKYQISIASIDTAEEIDGILLNTVINHGTEVAKKLSEKFLMCEVWDLYELIWLFLNERY